MPTKSEVLSDKLKKKSKIQLVKLAEKHGVSIYKNIPSSKSQLLSRLLHQKPNLLKNKIENKTKDKLQKLCLKHGISIYKHLPCKKDVLVKRLLHKMSKKSKKSKKSSKFGQANCYYEVPYFGGFVPSVSKNWSGTPKTGISSSAWMWPNPGVQALDNQQGQYNKY